MSLESMRARVEAATEGEWQAEEIAGEYHIVDGYPFGDSIGEFDREGDAEFAAHAKHDIPLLLKVAEAFAHHRECLDGVDGAFSGTDEEYEEANRRLAEAWDALDAAFDELESE